MAPFEDIPRPPPFKPQVWVPTGNVDSFHSAGRFGRHNDIKKAIYGSNDDTKDYLTGIIILAAVVLAIYLVWALVLIVLRCCRRRVGCASGRPFKPVKPKDVPGDSSLYSQQFSNDVTKSSSGAMPGDEQAVLPDWEGNKSGQEEFRDDSAHHRPAHSSEEQTIDYGKPALKSSTSAESMGAVGEHEAELSEYEVDLHKYKKRLFRTRIVFLLSGVSCIISSCLFYALGVNALIESLNSGKKTVENAESVISLALKVTNALLDSRDAAKNATDQMTEEARFESWCDQQIIDDAGISNEVSFIQDLLDQVTEALAAVQGTLDNEAENLSNDLNEALDMTDDVKSNIDQFYPYLYSAMAITIVVNIFVLALMATVVLTMMGKNVCFINCMRNIVILPIFIFLMIVAWILACVFLIGAVGGADVCNDPDGLTLSILNDNSDQFKSFVFAFLTYFISGCKEVQKPDEFDDGLDNAVTAINVIHNFTSWLSEPSPSRDVITEQCGYDTTNIKAIATVLDVALHAIRRAAYGVLDVFSCASFNPIYTSAMYDTLCVNAVDGFAWMFSTAICTAIFGMIMVTLRASWYYDADDDAATSSLDNGEYQSGLVDNPALESYGNEANEFDS